MSNNESIFVEAQDYFNSHWGKALLENETGTVIKKFCRMIGLDPVTAYPKIKEMLRTYESSH